MRGERLAGDGRRGALALADEAPLALRRVDSVVKQVSTGERRTPLLPDVRLELGAEVLERALNRVRSARAQRAERGVGQKVAQLLDCLEVALHAVAGGDAVEDFTI